MSTAFSVKPAAVEALATEIQGLANLTGYGNLCESVSGEEFVDSYVILGYVPQASLYSEIQGKTDDLRSGLQDILKALGGILSASATELEKTAKNYESIDAAAQARLDAAYPGGAKTSGTSQHSPLDRPSPLYAFDTPPELGSVDWVKQILTHDWTSPSDTVATIISLIFHWNPIDEISKRFVGDWTYVDRCASALKDLANFHRYLGTDVGQEVTNTKASWSGEAADAAEAWFWKQSTAGSKLGEELDKVAGAYETIASGMESACEVLTSLFAKIMDRIIYVVLLQVAALVTVETVVGTIIFEILDIIDAVSIPALVIEILEEFGKIEDLANGFNTLIGAAMAAFGAERVTFSFPGAYNNPQV